MIIEEWEFKQESIADAIDKIVKAGKIYEILKKSPALQCMAKIYYDNKISCIKFYEEKTNRKYDNT